jgi:hypothetical protein
MKSYIGRPRTGSMETRTVNALIAEVGPATDLGRLYPRYDESVGILAAESKFKRPWYFGVDIDGRIIFDLDDCRVLANFDLHIPKNRWIKDWRSDLLPRARPGDLILSLETIETKSFSLPLRVRSDEFCREVYIQIGSRVPDRSVELSSACLALLCLNELVGFVLRDFS